MNIQNWRDMALKMKITIKMDINLVRDVVRESQNYDKLKFIERWKMYQTEEKKIKHTDWLKWLKSHIKMERTSRAIQRCVYKGPIQN